MAIDNLRDFIKGIDKLGELVRVSHPVRARLEVTDASFPLACVLEGGTWAAGREMAKRLRPESGGPPLHIYSDGTVF